FKKSSRVGFAEYLGRIRIESAMELLAHSELRISAVAFEVGFQALSSFNRQFRRFTRMSPTEYRAISRQKWNGTCPGSIPSSSGLLARRSERLFAIQAPLHRALKP